jgi:hypothetical protein
MSFSYIRPFIVASGIDLQAVVVTFMVPESPVLMYNTGMSALLRLARLKGAALTSTAQGHKHGAEHQPSWAVFVPSPGVMLLVAPVTSRSVPFRWQLLRPRRRESGQTHCAGPYTTFAHACAQW